MRTCPRINAVTIGWRYWTAVCLVIATVGCESRDNRTSPVETQSAVQPVTANSCLHAGPLGCDASPVLDIASGGCAQLRMTLEGRQLGDDLVKKVSTCEKPVLSKMSDDGEAAAVSALLDVDGPPVHVSFLFVKGKQGWCPVDQVFEPTYVRGGYCKTEFHLRWEAGAGNMPPLLTLIGHRRCHEPLDKDEIAAGESDIAEDSCRVSRYEVDRAQNLVRKISTVETAQACAGP